MLDTPRSHKLPDGQRRSPGAGARAVLFGYLLRSGARDKAASMLERLDPEAIARLIGLLDGEELRKMAALIFSEPHLGRAVALDEPSLVRLARAGDFDDVERVLRRLPRDVVRRVLAELPEEAQRALSRGLDAAPGPTPRARPIGAADRFFAAFRLGRLFRR